MQAAPESLLTKDRLRQILLAIQALRSKGATEENNEEYAKLMRIMRIVTAQQQIQQQQLIQQKQQQQQLAQQSPLENGIPASQKPGSASAAIAPNSAPAAVSAAHNAPGAPG
ncbi:hypothetical protein GGI07_003408, partial [Coemansia sp. Benny D115]